MMTVAPPLSFILYISIYTILGLLLYGDVTLVPNSSFSLETVVVVCAILESISGLDSLLTDPRYLKLFTSSSLLSIILVSL